MGTGRPLHATLIVSVGLICFSAANIQLRSASYIREHKNPGLRGRATLISRLRGGFKIDECDGIRLDERDIGYEEKLDESERAYLTNWMARNPYGGDRDRIDEEFISHWRRLKFQEMQEEYDKYRELEHANHVSSGAVDAPALTYDKFEKIETVLAKQEKEEQQEKSKLKPDSSILDHQSVTKIAQTLSREIKTARTINTTVHEFYQINETRKFNCSVNCIAYRPDGLALATGGDDGSIKIWGKNGDLWYEVQRVHSEGVLTLAWSPDGSRLVTGGADSMMRVWDMRTMDQIVCIGSHRSWVMSASWSPDSQMVASGSDDSEIRLWDANTWQLVSTLTAHGGPVTSVVWSPNEPGILVSASSDNLLCVWEIDGSDYVQVMNSRFDQSLNSVAWGPDGQLAACLWDGSIALFASGETKPTIKPNVHEGSMVAAWTNDGRLVTGGVFDKTIKVWDSEVETPKPILRGAVSGSKCMSVWPGDRDRVIVGSLDGNIIVWDITEYVPR